MKITVSLLMLSLLSCSGISVAVAADAGKGKSRSAICAACHGVTGVSKQDIWPNLAGQKPGYIASQLKAYQSGARKDPAMDSIAKLLTDQEIADLAAYFEQQAPSEPQILTKKSTAAVTPETHVPD